MCHFIASRPAGVLLLWVNFGVCPSQILLQTYLSLGGRGECDGHAHGNSAGLVDWATVCLIVIIDVDMHAIHRSCLRHRSIYSIMVGKLCAKCSAAKPHGQF